MLLTSLTVDSEEFARRTGWTVKPEGACKGDFCVPLPSAVRRSDGALDVEVLAEGLGMPLVAEPTAGLWALGPESAVTGRALTTAQAPELELPSFDGGTFTLSSLLGTRVVVVAWASWCGCANDLPVWSDLRDRIRPSGIEVVSVAMDVTGFEAGRPFVDKAVGRQHPALLDQEHRLGELFGVVNVPNVLWIDEHGMIVRPPEPGFPGWSPIFDELKKADLDQPPGDANADMPLMNAVRQGDQSTLPPRVREMLELTREIRTEPELYEAMILDWAEAGSASRFVLSPDDVVRRSNVRTSDVAEAAAHFELGQHLHRAGRHDAAVMHFRAAHRLQPDNWTYKRQAWRFENEPGGDPTRYDSDWSRDVRAIGPENYYPKIVE
jgi:peroxiredoxin